MRGATIVKQIDTYLPELNKRLAELESGKVKGDSWEAVKQKARRSVKPPKGR